MKPNQEQHSRILCLAVYNDRLASVFDTVACLQLCRDLNGETTLQEKITLPTGDPLQRIQDILNYHADVLICGAISKCLERILREAGMEVRPWIRGTIPEVLAAWRTERLDALAMPGCRCPLGGPAVNTKIRMPGAATGTRS